MTRTSWPIPRSLELLRGLLHRRHVALRAHDDADARRVDLELVELLSSSASATVSGASVGRASALLAHAAMSRAQLAPVEGDHVGGSIRGRAGGGAIVAERGDARARGRRR